MCLVFVVHNVQNRRKKTASPVGLCYIQLLTTTFDELFGHVELVSAIIVEGI